MMVGGLGNGVEIFRPFLLKEERSLDGIMIRQQSPQVTSSLNFDSALVEIIHRSMEDVVVGVGGTGRRVRVPGIVVGGKSGSAENPHGEKTHGLFVACAPLDKPVIAIAAVFENAGHGGTVAAPVVGSLLRYFFAETDEGKRLVEKYAPKEKKKG
ncbi:MAG: hypothetical protein GY850_08395, partial [bacterium]|nr:hypothetical protein [bacterium]